MFADNFFVLLLALDMYEFSSNVTYIYVNRKIYSLSWQAILFSMPCASATPMYREWFAGKSSAWSKSIVGITALTKRKISKEKKKEKKKTSNLISLNSDKRSFFFFVCLFVIYVIVVQIADAYIANSNLFWLVPLHKHFKF